MEIRTQPRCGVNRSGKMPVRSRGQARALSISRVLKTGHCSRSPGISEAGFGSGGRETIFVREWTMEAIPLGARIMSLAACASRVE